MKSEKTVYIVHCVDTEGPLYEDPFAPFQQVKRIFGLDFTPNKENLQKLQNGTLNANGKEKAIQELLDPQKITLMGTWEKIKQMLQKLTSESFRNQLPDSDGKGWVFSWFCLDHVGFTGNNPRRRDPGHHKVFDHYTEMCQSQKLGDIVQFHHHPVSFSGNFNDSGTAYWGRSELNDILTRKVIDRKWFPVVFRPGFHTERPDSNWFLEQWIPFDYGNQSMRYGIDTLQPDLGNGRYGDWRHAPQEWYPYHPDHDDYQKKGNCRRWITRCLNMHARLRPLVQADVDDAFLQAQQGKNAILAFTDHDFRNVMFEVDKVRKLIKNSAQKYPDVKFLYSDALTAMRQCLELKPQEIGMNVTICKDTSLPTLKVTVKNSIFGPQPFLAMKFRNGSYHWDNFDFFSSNCWTYTFDENTVLLDQVEEIGVAAVNAYGNVQVEVFSPAQILDNVLS